jgi:hypothetical protein
MESFFESPMLAFPPIPIAIGLKYLDIPFIPVHRMSAIGLELW